MRIIEEDKRIEVVTYDHKPFEKSNRRSELAYLNSGVTKTAWKFDGLQR